MNDDDVFKLRSEVNRLKSELIVAEGKLANLVSRCSHHWTEPVYTPMHTPGYTISARTPENYDDVPYAMGYTQPPTVEPQWKRKCQKCGTVQVTSKFDESKTVNRTPKF